MPVHRSCKVGINASIHLPLTHVQVSLLGTASSCSSQGSEQVRTLLQMGRCSHSGEDLGQALVQALVLHSPCLMPGILALSSSSSHGPQGYVPFPRLFSSLPSFHHTLLSPPSPTPHSLLFPRRGLSSPSNSISDPGAHKTCGDFRNRGLPLRYITSLKSTQIRKKKKIKRVQHRLKGFLLRGRKLF